MSSSINRNVALRPTERPGSARRATEKDSLKRNDPPATSSSEVEFSAIMNALETIQKADLRVLRMQLYDWETKYKDLKDKYDKLTKQIEEKQELEDKLKIVIAQLKSTEETALNQKKELVLLQQRVESGDKSQKALNQKLMECMAELELKEKRLQTQQKALEEVQNEKDDQWTRLNRQTGQQESEGDPNIADLSDQNRPSKLGEMYSDLYDNEWTNAYEVLTETCHLDDKSAIELLLKILWESSKHASVVSMSTMTTIENLLSGSSEGLTPSCKYLLREAQRHVDITKADGLFQDLVREKLISRVRRTYLEKEQVELYLEKCVQLCWLMCIQDPPVVLSRDPVRGTLFDSNLYKHYTNSGDNVDYVVWPGLLLYKDGPVLAKGVAQPSPRSRAQSAPAVGSPAACTAKSVDTRSKTRYEKNIKGYTSGTGMTDTKQNIDQARNDVKVRESSFGSDRIDKTQHKHQDRNEEKAQESSFGSDSTNNTKYEYQSRNNEKVDKSTDDFDRLGKTQYGYQMQTDATLLPNLQNDSTASQKYSVDVGKCRAPLPTTTSLGQRQLSQGMQVNQHHSFLNMIDKERFQRFCENARSFKKSELQVIYGTMYDRFYRLYISQKCDN